MVETRPHYEQNWMLQNAVEQIDHGEAYWESGRLEGRLKEIGFFLQKLHLSRVWLLTNYLFSFEPILCIIFINQSVMHSSTKEQIQCHSREKDQCFNIK